jgi:hypothetical protein
MLVVWAVTRSKLLDDHKIQNGGEIQDEKLDDKILRKYVQQYVNDIFVEIDEQPSIHLISINIDTRQYFFNIFQNFAIQQ